MDSDIVVEVRGGCLVGVYCNDREQRFILLDWDDLNELPEAERMGGIFARHSFGEMRQDTRSVYDRTVSE
jgi:hypothetical protein